MNEPLHVTDREFQNKILDSSIPVIFDFWAPWCGPCKALAPILEKVAADYEGRVLVTKVNTDENPEWAIKFGVQGIPTMLFINQGELKSRMVGASPAPVIIAKTEELLQTASIQTNS